MEKPSDFGVAIDFLTSGKSLTPLERSRFKERISLVRAVLSVSQAPSLPEILYLVNRVDEWMPSVETLVGASTRRSLPADGWADKGANHEAEVWRSSGIVVSKALKKLFAETLEARGRERVVLDEIYGYAYGIIPDLRQISQKGDFILPSGSVNPLKPWVVPDNKYWAWLGENRLSLDAEIHNRCFVKPGVYLFDPRPVVRPLSSGDPTKISDPVLAAIAQRLVDLKEVTPRSINATCKTMHGTWGSTVAKMAELFAVVFQLPIESVALESVGELLALSNYKQGLQRYADLRPTHRGHDRKVRVRDCCKGVSTLTPMVMKLVGEEDQPANECTVELSNDDNPKATFRLRALIAEFKS